MPLHTGAGSDGELALDSDQVRGAAGHMSAVQLEWERELQRRDIALDASLFGAGLASSARGLLTRIDRGHQLRLSHARYLLDGADGARALADTVDNADTDSSATFNSGSFGGAR